MLSVELWDDNVESEHPDPKTRGDLRPYLRCYSLIDEGMAKSETEKLHPFRSNDPLLQQGKLALVPLLQVADSPDKSEQDSYLENTIALIRSRPRMVVRYLDPGGRSTANFAGVFLSHPDIEEQLHLSEPAAPQRLESRCVEIRRGLSRRAGETGASSEARAVSAQQDQGQYTLFPKGVGPNHFSQPHDRVAIPAKHSRTHHVGGRPGTTAGYEK